jgi:hypothetical protein
MLEKFPFSQEKIWKILMLENAELSCITVQCAMQLDGKNAMLLMELSCTIYMT